MTLIATSLAGNCPLLVGDLLISRPTTPATYQIHLPTQQWEVAGNYNYRITSLTQKLCVITPNLCLGWAGSRIAAQTIISEMLQSFGSGRPETFDELRKFFGDLDFPEAQDVEMVGLVREGNIVRGFNVKAKTYKSLLFGEMQVAGSGAEHFLEQLTRYEPRSLTFTPLSDVSNYNLSKYSEGVGKFLLVAASILGSERNTATNLSHFYGGGFEIVILRKGRFEKLNDVTYVFWEVTVISSDKLQIAMRVAVKCSYAEDMLLLHSIDFEGSVGEKVALFAVPPPYRNPNKTEVEKLQGTTLPDLNSHTICHYFSMSSRDVCPADRVIVEAGHRDIVNFTNEGNKVSFTVDKNLEEHLLNSIRKLSESQQNQNLV